MTRKVRHADGAAWPVKFGDIWQAGPHLLACGDLELGHGDYLIQQHRPRLTYSDPPWTAALASSFRSAAGVPRKVDFPKFIERLLSVVRHTAGDVWLEMGCQYAREFEAQVGAAGARRIFKVPITYYKTRPCWLYLLTWEGITDWPSLPGMAGMDDSATPAWVIGHTLPLGGWVFDPCLGLGATLAGVIASPGCRCLGLELNPVRLAASLSRVAHLNPVKVGSL